MHSACYFESIDDPALTDTVTHWQQQWPTGACLALVADKSKACIGELQRCLNTIGYPLLGAVFPELISYARFKSKGILLLLITDLPYYQLIEELPTDNNALTSSITALSDKLEPHLNTQSTDHALFLIFDSLIPNIGTLLEQLYFNLNDRLHYFGVNAGSETFQPGACLFDNDRFCGNGMLAILLPNHPGALIAHNYLLPNSQLTATSTNSNRINHINGRPAFEVYQELVEAQFDVVITVENFYAYAVHFPFGINNHEDEPLVRIPIEVEEDGSLYCVGEVPPGTTLCLLEALPAGSMDTVNAIGAHAPLYSGELVLTFYCAGRRLHLDKLAHNELTSLGTRLKPLNVMGAVSLGEIGNTNCSGKPDFHNAALVVAPWLT